MPATVRAALAATAILVTLSSPAGAATEEKSTKPRLAVLEFRAGAQLNVESASWGEWIADIERPQAAGGRANDRLRSAGEIVAPGSTAGKQPKSRQMVLAPGSTRPRPDASRRGTAIGQAIGSHAADGNEEAGAGRAPRLPPELPVMAGTVEGGDPDRPVIIGSVPNRGGAASVPETGDEVLVGMEHGDPAAGQATGKRQHMPIRTRATYDTPLQRGSVMLRLAQPWAGCMVGARFDSAYVTTGVSHRYRLDGAEIVGCDGSMVTINYASAAAAER